MECYLIMLKNTLFVVASAIAIVGSASLPAAAFGSGNLADGANNPTEVPEPSTILGTMVVGGIGLLSSKKSNQEQK